MADDLVDTRQIAARVHLSLGTVRDHARHPAFPLPAERETGPGQARLYRWGEVRAFYVKTKRGTLKPEEQA